MPVEKVAERAGALGRGDGRPFRDERRAAQAPAELAVEPLRLVHVAGQAPAARGALLPLGAPPAAPLPRRADRPGRVLDRHAGYPAGPHGRGHLRDAGARPVAAFDQDSGEAAGRIACGFYARAFADAALCAQYYQYSCMYSGAARRPGAGLRGITHDFYSHHCGIRRDFYESLIASRPRITGRAYFDQFWAAKFLKPDPIPRDLGLVELRKWLPSA